MTHLNSHKSKKTCDTCAFMVETKNTRATWGDALDKAIIVYKYGHSCYYYPEPVETEPHRFCSKWTRADWLWSYDVKQ